MLMYCDLGQNVPKLNSRPVYCSRLYGRYTVWSVNDGAAGNFQKTHCEPAVAGLLHFFRPKLNTLVVFLSLN